MDDVIVKTKEVATKLIAACDDDRMMAGNNIVHHLKQLIHLWPVAARQVFQEIDVPKGFVGAVFQGIDAESDNRRISESEMQVRILNQTSHDHETWNKLCQNKPASIDGIKRGIFVPLLDPEYKVTEKPKDPQ